MDENQAPPMTRPRVAAGALLFDENDNLLLVKPTYKPGWEIPGGYVEPSETPREACQREIKEELGLERQIERLLVVDWAPSDTEGDKVLFIFDGGALAGSDRANVVLPPQELSASAFHSADVLDDLVPDVLVRARLQALEPSPGLAELPIGVPRLPVRPCPPGPDDHAPVQAVEWNEDLAADPSRPAALLLPYIGRLCAVVAPCPPGASTPRMADLFPRGSYACAFAGGVAARVSNRRTSNTSSAGSGGAPARRAAVRRPAYGDSV